MRIILATPVYPPEIGGPATYTRELAERLKGEHQVGIVAYADEPEQISGVEVFSISKKTFILSRLVQYFNLLMRVGKEADIIYVQNAVASGLPAAIAGMLLRKPVVLKFVGDEAWERATQSGSTHENLDAFLSHPTPGIKAAVIRSIQKFTLTHVAKVVPPSAFLKDILIKYYGVKPERMEVNYNAFELNALLDAVPTRKPHQLLSVGRLVAWKGVEGIIRATAILVQEFPDVHLVVAGDGPEMKHLRKFVKEFNLEKLVTFTGRLQQAEVQLLQGESEVQVLNSTYEGLPHIALESFAAHTPLVATDIGGTNEAVYNEESGLLVPVGVFGADPEVLALAIKRIFNGPELRERITQGGAKLLREKFSWDSHSAKLLAVFEGVQHN